jgi:hypothetical protein
MLNMIRRTALDSDKCNYQWRSAYILTCCVYRNHSINPEILDRRICCDHDYDQDLVYISSAYRDVDGVVTRGGSHRHTPLDKCSPLVSDSAEGYLIDTVAVNSILIVKVVVRLKLSFFCNLVSYHRNRQQLEYAYNYNQQVNGLINEILPSDYGERILKTRDKYNAAPHVLFLEPDAPLLSEKETCSTGKRLSLLNSLHEQLGLWLGIVVPSSLCDMMLFTGLGINNSSGSIVAVRLAPYSRTNNDQQSIHIDIPKVAMEYVNHIAMCSIREYYSKLMRSHVFSSIQYWKLGSIWNNFKSYRKDYLRSRLQAEKLIIECEELEHAFSQSLRPIYIYSQLYIDLHQESALSNTIGIEWLVPISGVIKAGEKLAKQGLISDLFILKSRTKRLDDFLLDSAIADSTSSNLKLAKTVERLTWIVTIITLLTFILTLFPDIAKVQILSRILKNTPLEWLVRPN